MKTYHTIKEVEIALAPDIVDKYSVVLRCRVTQKEADAINEWIARRHGYYTISTERHEDI